MSELNYKDTVVKALALSHYSNVTPRMMEALLNHFGGLDRIFNSGAGTLMSISGMTTKAANKIARASEFIKKANEYYEQLMAVDIKIISRFDNEYPERLFELNDPPSILYYRGKLFQKDAKVVVVTGSDNASQEGIELTTSLAKHLASKNVGIVSSIYNGIDAAGHLGVKPSNGVSYAVLDSGLENIYPEENRPLAVDIVQGGALVTEFPPETKHNKDSFLASNRLIAAMSQAVIITEFYQDSQRTLDLLTCCSQIGKMIFIMIDPKCGALTDEKSLKRAITCGAIPMVGLDKVDDIVTSLV